MGLVIFAKRGYPGNAYPALADGETIHRLSGEVRGAQIAAWLGVPLNPSRRHASDTCIFVKGYRKEWAQAGDYIDVGDAKIEELAPWLAAHPDVRAIAIARHAERILRTHIANPLIYLPQQHVNWEDAAPEWPATFTAGYIGRPSRIAVQITDRLRALLAPLGVPFEACYAWRTREDAVAFYQRLHVLIVGGDPSLDRHRWQLTPTKLINAAAFGKPSISVPYDGYAEWEGYYERLETLEDVVPLVTALRDPAVYARRSDEVRAAAAPYHIRCIAARYRELVP